VVKKKKVLTQGKKGEKRVIPPQGKREIENNKGLLKREEI